MITEHLRKYAEDRFEQRRDYLQPVLGEITNRVETLSGDEAVCMKFLYGTMPLQDAGAYTFDVFLSYVRHSLWLRDTYAWCAALPEDIFIHYVMYYRINTEDICDCRSMFHDLTADRVRGMGLRDAILAVNYWCAENMIYESSDGRTESPLTAYRSGSGRCGEESTFAVTVLRSLGIAARQVYTPRWAHCDDNHAWVEVYLEGTWHFLGACEPEEVLNRGWFSHASSRAILVHSRTFSDYASNLREEVVGGDGVLVYHNRTSAYARSIGLSIQVKNSYGLPAAGAGIRIEILNMAEYSPAATLYADQNGEVSVTLGMGTVRLYAWAENEMTVAIVNTRSSNRALLQLKRSSAEGADPAQMYGCAWKMTDWEAPSDYPMHRSVLTREQKERRRGKLAEADRIRKNRLEGYYREEAAALYPKEAELLRYAGDNFDEIYAFLSKDDNLDRRWLLHSLSEKDWKDAKAEILETFLASDARQEQMRKQILEQYGEEVYRKEVLCPRIALETLTPYKPYIRSCFTTEEKKRFTVDPEELYRYIEDNIPYESGEDYSALSAAPIGCLKLRQGSPLSRRILFVSVCRTLGIPAGIDQATGEAHYRTPDGLRVPGRCVQQQKETGTLRLLSREPSRWIYGQTWTIGRWEDMQFLTMDYEGIRFGEDALELRIAPGCYRLITVSRMPNGNQYEADKTILLEAGQVYETDMPIRDGSLEDMLTAYELPDFEVELPDGKSGNLSSLLNRERGPAGCVLLFLEEGCEPTEHVLNEILQTKERWKHSGARLVFLLNDPSATENTTLRSVLEQLDISLCYVRDDETAEAVARRMYVDPDRFPLLVVIREGLTGVYACSGYNVGSVELMLKILNHPL